MEDIQNSILNEINLYYENLSNKLDDMKNNKLRCKQEMNEQVNFLYNFILDNINKIHENNLNEIKSSIKLDLTNINKDEIKEKSISKFCVFIPNFELNSHFKNLNQFGLFIKTDWYLNRNQLDFIKLKFTKSNISQFEWDKDVINLKYAFENFTNEINLEKICYKNIYFLEKSQITETIAKLDEFILDLKFEDELADSYNIQLKNFPKIIKSFSFLHFQNLKILRFKNGYLNLDQNVFINLNCLNVLDLSFIKINEICHNNFNGLMNLTELKLCYCGLTSIENNSFNNLVNLRELYISNNNLKTIRELTFNGLINLEILMLYKSGIDNIENNSFKYLTSLKELYLSSNVIKVIQTDTFKGLSRLERLDLSYCKIESIQNGSFCSLTNLKELHLSNNKIEYVEKNTFNGLFNLRELNLSDCGVKSIENDSFLNLVNLDYFYFFSNECCNKFEINKDKLRN